ncbi:uncharacterized protein LOC143570035 [Bidens hawaiensis]|uniref:uncharacterized protein LOC143570035 n=1 Tax=Bidens hawaiensis TaxID=980011 RepID=UPI00404943D6
MNVPLSFSGLTNEDARDMPLNISTSVAGHRVAWVYVDGGSGVEVMYEHYFTRLQKEVQDRQEEDVCPLVGFSGEVVKPLGSITPPFSLREGAKTWTVQLWFSVVRAPPKYNIILGRPGLRALRAIASTTHGCIKFPTPEGVATIRSSAKIIASLDPEGKSKKKHAGTEEWVLNGEFPDQTVKIGTSLTDKGRAGLKELLLRNVDVFAWRHEDMTGIPRNQVQHILKEFHWMEPVKQKKRSLGLEKSQAVLKETRKLLKTGIVRKVKYPQWSSNPVMIAKTDNSWRMCNDFKDLNKACPKDEYPFPEVEKKIESLAEYP